jgi:hypothetical protein
VGGFEIALGLAVLVDSTYALLLFVVAWKIVTESLYPISGAPFWEFIERGGSYIAPLALFFLVYQLRNSPGKSPASRPELDVTESF